MKPVRVTEPEIVDVLLGHAEPPLEDRVRRAVQTDLNAAATYADWSGATAVVRRGMAGQQDARLRVRDGVIARLRLPLPGDEALKLEPERSAWSRWMYRQDGRLRRAPLSAAAVALLAGAASLASFFHRGDLLVAEHIEGDVSAAQGGPGKSFEPLVTAGVVRLPVELRLGVGAIAELTLPPSTRLRARGPAHLEVTDRLQVSQTVGVVDYTVHMAPNSDTGFTVRVPQGAVIDLGTEFEVSVQESLPTVVRVRSGTVRVEPTSGVPAFIHGAERAIMTASRAVSESDPASPPVLIPAAAKAASGAPDLLELAYQPAERVMEPDSVLLAFIRPQQIQLRPQQGDLEGVTTAPPFTSTPVFAGTLQAQVNGESAGIALVCDQKVNGSLWVYLDENGNGDLTDDVRFEEGADFANGGLFAAGLMGRNDALWLRRPIVVDTSVTPPQAAVASDRFECINRRYLDGAVVLPEARKNALEVRHHFLLLDTDADGDFSDENGALGVWAMESAGAELRILNAAPLDAASTYMGYRWKLARKLSGEYALTGEKLSGAKREPLRVGERLPRVSAQTVGGDPIEVAPPAKGYLLLYTWSTWYSACNRDVPFDMNDLYPKFNGRGLEMIGISMDYRKEDLDAYLRQKEVAYPQIFNGPDAIEGIAADLGLLNWPSATLIDSAGVVVKTGESAAEIWSFLDANLPK